MTDTLATHYLAYNHLTGEMFYVIHDSIKPINNGDMYELWLVGGDKLYLGKETVDHMVITPFSKYGTRPLFRPGRHIRIEAGIDLSYVNGLNADKWVKTQVTGTYFIRGLRYQINVQSSSGGEWRYILDDMSDIKIINAFTYEIQESSLAVILKPKQAE